MSQKFQYGSAEYLINQSKEHLDKALAAVEKLRVESRTIKPINTIKFGSDWLNKGRIEGHPGRNPDSFVTWSYYSSFDDKREDHITKSYEAALKWHAAALAEVEKWHLENLPDIENNIEARKSIENFMNLVGIKRSYSVSEQYRGKQKSVDKSAGYLSDITRDCPVTDGYETAKNQLVSFLKNAEDWKKNKLAAIQKTKLEKEKSDKELRKIAKAMELAAKWDIKYSTNDELIAAVDEIAQEKWVEENFEEGEEIDHSCCDSCSTWKYGEHRCSCGNRRMGLTIEGNFFDGFSYYAEAN